MDNCIFCGKKLDRKNISGLCLLHYREKRFLEKLEREKRKNQLKIEGTHKLSNTSYCKKHRLEYDNKEICPDCLDDRKNIINNINSKNIRYCCECKCVKISKSKIRCHKCNYSHMNRKYNEKQVSNKYKSNTLNL